MRTGPALLLAAAALLAATLPAAHPLAAQESVSGIDASMLRAVMPGADRFEPKSGDPPVLRAYRDGALVGFVFATADIPPEQLGYSGPVQAVVGLGLDGVVTGARVTEYRESYRSSMGDFLRRPGVQEQFRGKSLVDPFLVNGDVERVTRATISTQALARGIRDASRRVAESYGDEMEVIREAGPVVLEKMSWFEMRTRGVLKRILIEGPEGHLDISMAHLPDDSVAEFFLGAADVERMHAGAERWEVEDPVFIMYALEGPRLRYFLRERWQVAQSGDTLPLSYEQVYNLGLTEEGRVAPESVLGGVFMLDGRVDPTRPFDLLYEMDGHEGYYVAHFDALEEGEAVAAGPEAAEEDEPAEPPPDPSAGDTAAPAPAVATGADAPPPVGVADSAPPPADSATLPADAAGTLPPATGEDGPAPSSRAGDPAVEGPAPGPPEAGPGGDVASPPEQLAWSEEGSELSRTLAGTDWSRVARTAGVLLLALGAFFLKKPLLGALSMGATLLVLGFVDGSFLSISHATAAIWVGPGVFARDLPLLLLVVATLLLTLVWGRVFCGFLCPFGVVQEILERVVPERLRFRVPSRLHRRGLAVKYVVLAGILVPAVLGSRASLYQWFEPFGTVFFPSPSVVLWTIAGAFLLGAAVVPRFYCRYVCPLGAGLALLSRLSPRRIPRVEQCRHCVVCQHDCPTGAIEGPAVDFPECVRCNRCEINLRERVGTCRHEMEEVRSRLVQIRVGTGGPRG